MAGSGRKTFTVAPAVGATAGVAPASAQVEPEPMSDSASLLASNIARNRTPSLEVTAADLLEGQPELELDLVPVNVRVPRYLAQALDLQAKLTRQPRQRLVAESLYQRLDPRIVAMSREKLSG